jgi:hypothetical protein
LRCLTCLVAISPIALLTACGGAASPTISSNTTALPAPPAAIGPATARELSAVRTAAAHTLTLRVAMSLRTETPPSVPYPPITATGAFDLAAASGHATVQDSVGTETIVYTPARIFDERPPAEATGLPQGRPWIRADFAEKMNKKSPYLAQYLLRLEQRDPGFPLAEVAWGAQTAAPLGTSAIDGVQATGYLVTVNAARAAAAASGPRAQGFIRTAAFAEQILGGTTVTQTIYVWVDAQGRVVSLRTDPVAGSGATTVINLTSFGVRVKLSPPGASEIVDLAAVVGVDLDHD